MIGDDDSDDSDDGILPSAGPTDRRNNQQIHKVTAFCHEQDQRIDKKRTFLLVGDDDSDDGDYHGHYDNCTYHNRA